MASWWTNKGKRELAALAATSADLRVLLVHTAPASAGVAADLNFVADVVANELTATNYARKALANITVTEDDTNDRAVFDADDPSTYSLLGGAANDTVVGAWIFRQVTNDADSALWIFLDLAPDLPTNGGDVTLQFATAGLSTVS